MKIGIPTEIKNNENRIGITPAGVRAFIDAGHTVVIENNAGIGSGFTNEDFLAAGALIENNPAKVWENQMVIKVKEPLPSEYQYLRADLILYTYLHLAPAKELTEALLEAGTTGIAYETIQLADGSVPLLTPMSEIAGRMSVQLGAQFLEKPNGGKGILLAGVPGVSRGNVVIIGGGNSGTNAAKIAVGMGANVTILDVQQKRLAELDDLFGNNVQTLLSNAYNIEESLKTADVVIGAVLIPGAKAPTLVTDSMVKQMPEGSVIIDIAIDQGGIFETVDRVTTHDAPTYVKYGVIHYAVANMPGAVAQTATIALTNATLSYGLAVANHGVETAVKNDDALRKGINTYQHKLTCEAVSLAQETAYTPLESLIG